MKGLRPSQLKQLAKEKLNGNWGAAIGLYLLAVVISYAASYVGGLGELFVMGPLAVGLCCVFLNLYRRGSAQYNDLFAGFDRYRIHFGTGMLVYLFLTLWTLLLIVPGIIKSYEYSQAFFIQYDHPEMRGTDAIRASREMMKGHKKELFLLDLSFWGWFVLCFLTYGALLVYVAPYYYAARVAFYENLKNGQATDDSVQTDPVLTIAADNEQNRTDITIE